MERLLSLVNQYTVEIIVVTAISILLVNLVRSFKRNLLIGHGQARLVLEKYDHHSGIFRHITSIVVVLLLASLLVYVNYFNSPS